MENNFAGKGTCTCSLSLPRNQGKIEKSFSPILTDYFIQGVRNISPLGHISQITRQPVFALTH